MTKEENIDGTRERAMAAFDWPLHRTFFWPFPPSAVFIIPLSSSSSTSLLPHPSPLLFFFFSFPSPSVRLSIIRISNLL